MDIISQNMFDELVARHKQSGLSITKFCKQETISLSKFYSLRRKFLPRIPEAESPDESIGFAPIHITNPPEVTFDSLPEITINLPSGVIINFRGMSESNIVSLVLTQICQSHVLSK